MTHVLHIFTSSQSAHFFMSGQFDYLVNNGFEFTILVPDDGFYKAVKTSNPKCNVSIIPIVRKISIYNDFKSLFFLLRKIYKLKPDIIHLHTPKAGLIGSLASRVLFRKNIIFHLHGLVSVNGGVLKKDLTYYFERLSFLLAHKVISVSPSLKDFCVENKLISQDKIHVIHNGTINGIDCEYKFNIDKVSCLGLKKSLNIENKFIIGFLGRVTWDKGIKDLLRVYKVISQNNSNVVLCIIGPNELDIDINLLFSGIDNVIIIDRVENPEDYLKMFDIQLFPSVREGFGLALAEASAVGTPSVAYNIFGIRDAIVDNYTGTLAPFNDYIKLTQAVQDYINNPDMLKRHSLNGIDYIRSNFKQLDVWKGQKKFYLDLINNDKKNI